MKKNCRKPGLARSASSGQGAASRRNAGTAGEIRSARNCRTRPETSAQTSRIPPGSTTATSPLERNPAAANAPAAAARTAVGRRDIGAAQRREPGEQRGREEEGQDAVGQVRPRRGEAERRCEQEDGAREPFPAPAEPPDGAGEQKRRRRAEKARRKPCGPRRLAEEREGGRVAPVEQRRLLEVGHAVQARRDEVAGGEHFARDLGIAGLVGLREPGAGRLEPDRREQGEQRRDEKPSPRPEPRLSVTAATSRSPLISARVERPLTPGAHAHAVGEDRLGSRGHGHGELDRPRALAAGRARRTGRGSSPPGSCRARRP